MEKGSNSRKEWDHQSPRRALEKTEEDRDVKVSDLQEQDAQNTKFTLPMEPTESLDRNRDYPPIVTADGWVDTDIDHLMENPEDEFDDVPIQDIPSKFPKPHLIRVIDGSLDDDIDNLMNHDGTMAHTLVDAPKHFNKSDLKEINSKKSGKKNNAQGQANRSVNKMSQEHWDEDSSEASNELVPYSERNNSSNEILQSSGPVFEQNNPINPPPINMASPGSGKESIENGDFFEQKNSSNKLCEVGRDEEIVTSVTPDGTVVKKSGSTLADDKEESNKDNEKGPPDLITTSSNLLDTISNANSTESVAADDVSKLVQQVLSRMSLQDLQKRLDAETDNILQSVSQTNETLEGGHVRTNEDNEICNADIISPADVSQAEPCVELKSDVDEIIKRELIEAVIKKPSTHLQQSTESGTPMQDAMAMLKLTLDNIMKESREDSQTDSQRVLAVTALKVAGDSMTAAAKMADALTLLVKTSHSSLSTTEGSHVPPHLRQVWGTNPSNDGTNTKYYYKPTGLNSVSRNDRNVCSPNVTPADEKVVSNKRKYAKGRKPKEITPNLDRPDNDSDCPYKLLSCKLPCNRTKKEIESKNKLKMDTTDDDADRGERKIRDQRRESRQGYEQFKHLSPPCREHIEKTHERRSLSEARHQSKEERHKPSAKQQDDNFDDDNNRVEKHENLMASQRRKEKDSKKKHESDYKKKMKKNELEDNVGYEQRQCEWTRYEDRKEVMKRHEKQMRSGEDNDIINADTHQRHKSQRERKFRAGIHKAKQDTYDPHSNPSSEKPVLSEEMLFHEEVVDIKRSPSSKKSNMKQRELEDLGKSDPWSLPAMVDHIHGERYFDHVVRRLKHFSPTRGSTQPNSQKEYIRAKLVGSCVDPYARDSDFDSIEFNGNARMSLSRVVRFDEESDSRADEAAPIFIGKGFGRQTSLIQHPKASDLIIRPRTVISQPPQT